MAAAMRRQASQLLPRRPHARFSTFSGWCRCVAGAPRGPQPQRVKTATRRQDARGEGVLREAAELRSKRWKIRDREERLGSGRNSPEETDDHNHGCFA